MSNLEDQFAQLKSQLATAELEYQSLKSGRKSAAPRLRKSLMSLKTGSHAMRAGTTSFVRELPTKSRKKASEDLPLEPLVEVEPVAIPAVEVPKKPTRSRKKTPEAEPED